jgi:hypothetical protein
METSTETLTLVFSSHEPCGPAKLSVEVSSYFASHHNNGDCAVSDANRVGQYAFAIVVILRTTTPTMHEFIHALTSMSFTHPYGVLVTWTHNGNAYTHHVFS